MKSEKKYKTIKEVSKILDINSHVIRYWDSKFSGLSIRLHANKQRFFNQENIKKIKELKDTIYQNGKHIYSLDLANEILKKNRQNSLKNNDKDLAINDYADGSKDFNLNELRVVRKNLASLLNY